MSVVAVSVVCSYECSLSWSRAARETTKMKISVLRQRTETLNFREGSETRQGHPDVGCLGTPDACDERSTDSVVGCPTKKHTVT